MSRYSIEVNTHDLYPLFLTKEYLDSKKFWDFFEKHINDEDKEPTTKFSMFSPMLAKMNIYVERLPKHVAKYISSSAYKCFLDTCDAFMGYDEGMETWFLQAFNHDIDDCPTPFLWLGDWHAQFPTINHLLFAISVLEINIFMDKQTFHEFREECASLGEYPKSYFYFLEESFSGQMNDTVMILNSCEIMKKTGDKNPYGYRLAHGMI